MLHVLGLPVLTTETGCFLVNFFGAKHGSLTLNMHSTANYDVTVACDYVGWLLNGFENLLAPLRCMGVQP